MTKDLQSKQLIYLKAILFIVILILAIFLNLTTTESFLRLVSITLIIWSSARLYYFSFYVIEKYVDKDFRFSGLFDFLLYLTNKKKNS
jgi:hypothetical protein